MRAVWKYPLQGWSVPLQLPIGAKVVFVGEQVGCVMLWAEVDTNAPTEERIFDVVGTGAQPPTYSTHVGSVQIFNASSVRLTHQRYVSYDGEVYHVYERSRT